LVYDVINHIYVTPPPQEPESTEFWELEGAEHREAPGGQWALRLQGICVSSSTSPCTCLLFGKTLVTKMVQNQTYYKNLIFKK
jgi:hypothetical protein